MKPSSFALLVFSCPALLQGADPFEEGMRALAGRNYSTALSHMEEAIVGDPDNLRFASEYRQAVISAKEYDRALKFFEKLTVAAPKSANVFLNYGFAYVDKIPAAGSITQVILADKALSHFSKSIELKPTWIALYTRGNSYLFWPRIFGRAPLGIADLERAMAMQTAVPKKSVHVRVYVSLGDGYWKTDNIDKARATWKAGLKEFPSSTALSERLALDGDGLKAYIDDVLDPGKRVDTNLKDVWMDR